jgi:hypothetical protein
VTVKNAFSVGYSGGSGCVGFDNVMAAFAESLNASIDLGPDTP